jgi:hypothetical protein
MNVYPVRITGLFLNKLYSIINLEMWPRQADVLQ